MRDVVLQMLPDIEGAAGSIRTERLASRLSRRAQVSERPVSGARLSVDYLRGAAHQVPEFGWEAVLYKDCSETGTAAKRVFADFPKRIRKHNFFEPALFKTEPANALHSARNFNGFETFTLLERLILYSL